MQTQLSSTQLRDPGRSHPHGHLRQAGSFSSSHLSAFPVPESALLPAGEVTLLRGRPNLPCWGWRSQWSWRQQSRGTGFSGQFISARSKGRKGPTGPPSAAGFWGVLLPGESQHPAEGVQRPNEAPIFTIFIAHWLPKVFYIYPLQPARASSHFLDHKRRSQVNRTEPLPPCMGIVRLWRWFSCSDLCCVSCSGDAAELLNHEGFSESSTS